MCLAPTLGAKKNRASNASAGHSYQTDCVGTRLPASIAKHDLRIGQGPSFKRVLVELLQGGFGRESAGQKSALDRAEFRVVTRHDESILTPREAPSFKASGGVVG